jgi:hypothetical protein
LGAAAQRHREDERGQAGAQRVSAKPWSSNG